MIDHIGIKVADYPRSKAFYETVLPALGYRLIMEGLSGAGFGKAGIPFWIKEGIPTPGVHIAFQSPDRASVDAFHAAALKAGARDNGAPGLRPHYHGNYYGAFVLDPDGYNIEAVCHLAEA